MPFLIQFLLFYTFTVSTFASDNVIKLITGKAYNKKNKLIYTEKHIETYSKNGALLSLNTKYYDLDEKLFAELNSDFTNYDYLPDHKYEDSRMKRTDGTRSVKGKKQIVAFAKANENSKLKEKTFDATDDLISGQGFYAYFYKNFDNLKNIKKALYIKFLIPMQQAKYSFYIEKHSSNENSLVFRIKFSNWFIRMLAPYIQLTYDIKTKKLLEFKGPSNVPGEDGEIQNVTIKYD